MLEEYERQPACRAICEENPGYELELVREKQVGHSLCCRAFPRDAEQYVRDALARWLIGGVARGRDDDTSRWRRPCERGGFIMGGCWAAGARAGNSRDVGNGNGFVTGLVWCCQLEFENLSESVIVTTPNAKTLTRDSPRSVVSEPSYFVLSKNVFPSTTCTYTNVSEDRTDEKSQPSTVPDKQRLGPTPPHSHRLPSIAALMQYDRIHPYKRGEQWTGSVLRTLIILLAQHQPITTLFLREVTRKNLGKHLVSGLDDVCQPQNALVIVEQA